MLRKRDDLRSFLYFIKKVLESMVIFLSITGKSIKIIGLKSLQKEFQYD